MARFVISYFTVTIVLFGCTEHKFTCGMRENLKVNPENILSCDKLHYIKGLVYGCEMNEIADVLGLPRRLSIFSPKEPWVGDITILEYDYYVPDSRELISSARLYFNSKGTLVAAQYDSGNEIIFDNIVSPKASMVPIR